MFKIFDFLFENYICFKKRKRKGKADKFFLKVLFVMFVLFVSFSYFFPEESDNIKGNVVYFLDDFTSFFSESSDVKYNPIDLNLLESVDSLYVYFIDVGQGDAIFVVYPSNKTMLVDAGDNGKGRIVIDFINDLGFDHVDYLIATHPHADHIGGIDEILSELKVYNYMDNGQFSSSKTYEDVLVEVEKLDDLNYYNVLEDIYIEMCNLTQTKVIAPFAYRGFYFNGFNENSLVVRIKYYDFTLLLTGDCETECEKVLYKHNDVKSTIFKVGHHGSKSSNNVDFLRKVNPDVGVIMVGKSNRYSHPHKEVFDRFFDFGVDIYRTDTMGSIYIQTNGTDYIINTEI
jgi:competence protein ComEC